MSCREATRLISEGMNRPQRFGERLSLRWHLLVSTACRRYRRQLLLLRNALRWLADQIDARAAEGERLSPEARQRIRQAVREQT